MWSSFRCAFPGALCILCSLDAFPFAQGNSYSSRGNDRLSLPIVARRSNMRFSEAGSNLNADTVAPSDFPLNVWVPVAADNAPDLPLLLV